MTKKYSITVGIIVYNREHLILDAIRSVLNQTIYIDELVIVDDGSSDNTKEVVDRVKDNRITLISNDINKGIPYSRNVIINNSVGDLIFFFDSDDISLNNRVLTQYNMLTNNDSRIEENILCYCSRLIIDTKGNQTSFPGLSPDNILSKELSSKLALYILGVYYDKNLIGSTATCTLAASKQLLKKLNGFDESFLRSEDTELALRHSLTGGRFISSSKNLVKQRISKKNYDVHKVEYEYYSKIINKWSHLLTIQQFIFSISYQLFKLSIFNKKRTISLCLFIFLFTIKPKHFLSKIISSLSSFKSTLQINEIGKT